MFKCSRSKTNSTLDVHDGYPQLFLVSQSFVPYDYQIICDKTTSDHMWPPRLQKGKVLNTFNIDRGYILDV